jgi:hypothetical protein
MEALEGRITLSTITLRATGNQDVQVTTAGNSGNVKSCTLVPNSEDAVRLSETDLRFTISDGNFSIRTVGPGADLTGTVNSGGNITSSNCASI